MSHGRARFALTWNGNAMCACPYHSTILVEHLSCVHVLFESDAKLLLHVRLLPFGYLLKHCAVHQPMSFHIRYDTYLNSSKGRRRRRRQKPPSLLMHLHTGIETYRRTCSNGWWWTRKTRGREENNESNGAIYVNVQSECKCRRSKIKWKIERKDSNIDWVLFSSRCAHRCPTNQFKAQMNIVIRTYWISVWIQRKFLTITLLITIVGQKWDKTSATIINRKFNLSLSCFMHENYHPFIESPTGPTNSSIVQMCMGAHSV